MHDILPEEVGGVPDYVFWPTEGLDYNIVTFKYWSRYRVQFGRIWHDVVLTPTTREVDSAWARLLEDDDD